MKKWLIRSACGLALGACALLVLQAFVCDVYRVESGSMEPVLHGPDGGRPGESVLISYGVEDPERFELVVLRRPDEPAPFVKRIVGLPGETISISGGDLLVDGKRLPVDAPRPEPLLVFDESRMPMERAFPELVRRGSRADGAWRIESAPGTTIELAYAPRLTDGHWNAAGEWVEGSELANDLGVEVEVRLLSSDAALGIELTEAGDRYRAVASRSSDGGFDVVLSQREQGGEFRVRSAVTRQVAPDAWHLVAFENCDNGLITRLDGGPMSALATEPNVALVGAPDPKLTHGLPRVTLRVTGSVWLRNPRITRDRYWVGRGTHAVDTPAQLGPDEVFVLGDHSAESFDSRQYGPVKLSALLGRPRAVVRPWAAARRLAGPRPRTETP